VLYVAMTRARHRLDLLVQPAGARGAPKRSFATLVRHALGEPGAPGARDDDDGRPAPDGPVELWRQPDTVAAWSPPARPLDPDAWRPAHVPLELASGPPRRPVRAAPSTLAGGRAVRAADLLRAEPGLARARGSVIHRWMAEIGWLEDFDAAARRDELLALGVREARALGVDPGSVPAWLDELVGWLRRPVTRAQLERAACPLAGPGVEIDVWRERRFAVCLPATPGPAPSAAGAPDRADAAAPKHLLAGSFDRVVLARREDRPVAALVVDFKTDALAAGDEGALASQVEHHRPQMQAYRRALAALTGLQPDDVGCRLLFLAADRAADA
jgi:ATP-dependent exoDNAse (exonuclease V) beta subunit